jgi:cation transport ATPase
MLFDKTGTLTHGKPTLADIVTARDRVDADVMLPLPSTRCPPTVLASSIVTAAEQRGLALEMPEDVTEEHGYGLRGPVGDHEVRVGKAGWIVGETQPAWGVRYAAGPIWTVHSPCS